LNLADCGVPMVPSAFTAATTISEKEVAGSGTIEAVAAAPSGPAGTHIVGCGSTSAATPYRYPAIRPTSAGSGVNVTAAGVPTIAPGLAGGTMPRPTRSARSVLVMPTIFGAALSTTRKHDGLQPPVKLLSVSVARTCQETVVPSVNAAAGMVATWLEPEVWPAVSAAGTYCAATPDTAQLAFTRSPCGASA